MRRDRSEPAAKRGDRRKWRVCERTGCHVWTGAIAGSGTGYGYVKVKGRAVRAHRYWYTRLVGPVPKRRVLHHKCGNTRCVNPAHLEPTTQRHNVQYYMGLR